VSTLINQPWALFITGIEVDKSQGNSPIDYRPSAISMGSSSAIILVILIVGVIVLDAEGCYRAVRYRGKAFLLYSPRALF